MTAEHEYLYSHGKAKHIADGEGSHRTLCGYYLDPEERAVRSMTAMTSATDEQALARLRRRPLCKLCERKLEKET